MRADRKMSYTFYSESRNGASKSIAPQVLRSNAGVPPGLDFKNDPKSHNTSKNDNSP